MLDEKGSILKWSLGFLVFGSVVAVLAIGLFLLSTEGGISLESFKGKKELTEDPGYLQSDKFESKKAAVNGIGLGDNESKLKHLGPSSKDKDGWLFTTDGTGYRVFQGKVIEILLSLEDSEKSGFMKKSDVKAKLGKPDNIEGFSGYNDYFYPDKGLIVTVSEEKPGISEVQVRMITS